MSTESQETPNGIPTHDGDELSSSLISKMENTLRKDPEIGPKLSEMEEIDLEVEACLKHVDLNIASSPVILGCRTSTREAVEISYRGEDGRYVIANPFKMLSEEECKKARARFLVVRGREMRPALDRLFTPNQREAKR